MSAPRLVRRDDLDVDYSDRAGFLTGKAAALAEWHHRKSKRDDEKLFAVLRARRWAKTHPEQVRANNAKSDRKRYARRREERAWLVRGHVLTCKLCKVQWCRVPCRYMGPEPKYCLNGCRKRAAHALVMASDEKRAAAVQRATAWRAAHLERRRAYQAAWMRKKRAEKRQ